jgi:hypothetical protein
LKKRGNIHSPWKSAHEQCMSLHAPSGGNDVGGTKIVVAKRLEWPASAVLSKGEELGKADKPGAHGKLC